MSNFNNKIDGLKSIYYNTEIRKIDSETSLNRITRYEMLITFDCLTNIVKNVVIRMIFLSMY